MKAELIVNKRIVLQDGYAFVEILVWKVPSRVKGSDHDFKYSLALVADEVCVLRYDNERGKGDHRHYGNVEQPYPFRDKDALLADFYSDVQRWLHEHGTD